MDEWHLGDKSVKQKIIDIALEHNLVSKFTSFVAIEHKIVNPSDIAQMIPIPIDLPEGWDYNAIFGGPPDVAHSPQHKKIQKPDPQKMQAPSQNTNPKVQNQQNRITRILLPGTATDMPSYFVFGLSMMLISLMILIRIKIGQIKSN